MSCNWSGFSRDTEPTGQIKRQKEIDDIKTDVRQWIDRQKTPMQKTQETQLRSLGWDNPLKEEMATYSSILAWKIPQIEEPGRLQPVGSQRIGYTHTHTHTHTHLFYSWKFIPLNPLTYSVCPPTLATTSWYFVFINLFLFSLIIFFCFSESVY